MSRYQVVNRRGCRLLLDNTNWIDMRLLIGQPFENEQIETCIELIEKNRIDTFIDVGANIGFYSILIAMKSSVRKVIAFEPVARNYNQLCGNIFINGLNSRISPVKKALSADAKSTTIHIDPRSTGVSRISLDGIERDSTVFTNEESIDCIRLDDTFTSVAQRVFIKIDVEGHEMEALQGMRRVLQENSVFPQVESLSSERTEELVEFFTDLNYEFLGMIDSDCRFSNF